MNVLGRNDLCEPNFPPILTINYEGLISYLLNFEGIGSISKNEAHLHAYLGAAGCCVWAFGPEKNNKIPKNNVYIWKKSVELGVVETETQLKDGREPRCSIYEHSRAARSQANQNSLLYFLVGWCRILKQWETRNLQQSQSQLIMIMSSGFITIHNVNVNRIVRQWTFCLFIASKTAKTEENTFKFLAISPRLNFDVV